MTQTDFAAFAGVSKVTVTKWKKKGFVVLTDDGLVDVGRSIILLRDRGYGNFETVTHAPEPVTQAEQPSDVDGRAELTTDEIAERLVADPRFALLSHAEAERLKENFLALSQRLKYEREAGRLVDAAEVETRHAKRWSDERVAWENWPSAVCADMAAELGLDAIKLRVTLEAFVEKHLNDRVRRGEHAAVA